MKTTIRRQTTFWDKRSGRYDEKVGKHDAQYDRTIARARSLLDDSDTLLDFGCASGEFSVDLAPGVQRVHGIDLSVKMIELARQKARDRRVDNATFDRTDLFDPALASGSFSAIVAFNVLHLVDDPSKVLARLGELLAPGGLLISQTPCLAEWRWYLRSLVRLACTLGLAPPIRSLTFAELESLVARGPFAIVENELWEERHSVRWIVARKNP
jgi:2-polyprenyl-3-methyl-5-hydroxy-6-metoxy-1,4-benzoquinol methylase